MVQRLWLHSAVSPATMLPTFPLKVSLQGLLFGHKWLQLPLWVPMWPVQVQLCLSSTPSAELRQFAWGPWLIAMCHCCWPCLVSWLSIMSIHVQWIRAMWHLRQVVQWFCIGWGKPAEGCDSCDYLASLTLRVAQPVHMCLAVCCVQPLDPSGDRSSCCKAAVTRPWSTPSVCT